MPAWLDEGTAEFYSTLTVNTNRTTIGATVPAHRVTLANQRWLTAGQLSTAQTFDAVFYAESWALVHMLNLAPEYRQHVPDFFSRLLADQPDPFQQAFGRSLDQALADLRLYLPRMNPVIVSGSIEHGDNFAVAPLSKADSAAARAELALHVGHFELARSFIADIEKSPATEAVLAGLESNPAAAIEHLERSIALGSHDASVWVELALRQRQAGASPAVIDQLLRDAIKTDPRSADAPYLLGVRMTDAGDAAHAIPLLTEAARLRPRESSYWYALAFALEKAGFHQQALEVAQKAVRTSRTSTEDALAVTLRDSLIEK